MILVGNCGGSFRDHILEKEHSKFVKTNQIAQVSERENSNPNFENIPNTFGQLLIKPVRKQNF